MCNVFCCCFLFWNFPDGKSFGRSSDPACNNVNLPCNCYVFCLHKQDSGIRWIACFSLFSQSFMTMMRFCLLHGLFGDTSVYSWVRLAVKPVAIFKRSWLESRFSWQPRNITDELENKTCLHVVVVVVVVAAILLAPNIFQNRWHLEFMSMCWCIRTSIQMGFQDKYLIAGIDNPPEKWNSMLLGWDNFVGSMTTRGQLPSLKQLAPENGWLDNYLPYSLPGSVCFQGANRSF